MARTTHRTVINDSGQIPAFGSEREEQHFWDTHEAGPGLIATPEEAARIRAKLPPSRALTIPVPTSSETGAPNVTAVSARLTGDTVRRLKAMAARKGTGYQRLLRDFVVERLYEEEVREGVIQR